jgi:GNAT superfamily N-acetyltransferase
VIDPIVRPAEAGDAAQLQALERGAREALIEQRGGRRWLETHPVRGDGWIGAMTDGYVQVADIDGVVVGYLVAELDSPVARIVEVYVLDEARELGFGDALVEAVVEAAKASGCTSIEGEALPGDRDTKNLYERARITARLIIVARQL